MDILEYLSRVYEMGLIASRDIELFDGEIVLIPCAEGSTIRKEYGLNSNSFSEISRVVKSNNENFKIGEIVNAKGYQKRFKNFYGINFYIYMAESLEKLQIDKKFKINGKTEVGIEGFRILAGDHGCQMDLEPVDLLWKELEKWRMENEKLETERS